jgi:hypothetical protein
MLRLEDKRMQVGCIGKSVMHKVKNRGWTVNNAKQRARDGSGMKKS